MHFFAFVGNLNALSMKSAQKDRTLVHPLNSHVSVTFLAGKPKCYGKCYQRPPDFGLDYYLIAGIIIIYVVLPAGIWRHREVVREKYDHTLEASTVFVSL